MNEIQAMIDEECTGIVNGDILDFDNSAKTQAKYAYAVGKATAYTEVMAVKASTQEEGELL